MRDTPYTLEMPVYSDDGRAFGAVMNRRVLIYWPHGFGDFVHLSFVVPLLEPSNEYFVTRFGDDFVHLYDCGERVLPLFSGTRVLGSGAEQGARPHFGLDLDRPPDGITRLDVPEPMRSRIQERGIETLLVCRYPEMTGRTPYPWQTKARYLASRIAAPQRLACTDLSQPLRSSLAFRAPLQAEQRIEARLREAIPTGARLYVLSAGGHTQVDKVWPEHEIAAFAREVRRRDSHARLVTVDERTSAVIGRERVSRPRRPISSAISNFLSRTCLLRSCAQRTPTLASASGPLHAAIAMGGRPTVGIWLAHWPEYYDEPSSEAIHLVGPEVYRRGLDRRIGARTKARAGVLPYRIEAFRDRPPTSADALDALERV